MELKKNPKVDISSWSHIFFLVGFALMLFISWQVIELKSYDKGNLVADIVEVGDDLELEVPITEQLTPPPPPPPPPPVVQTVIQVIEDDEQIEETIIESTETDQNEEIVEIEDIEEVDVEEEEIEAVPFAVIEEVPIYPGCENAGNRAAKKQCMADKVMKFVQMKFNSGLASDLGLEGRQRINVIFKIDKHGNVADIKARAPHPRLEEEAILVVGSLPKMIPGKQRGKPVPVSYALPILFKVESFN